MTDSAKLDLLISEMREMKTDMQEMKKDVQETKKDVQKLKEDVQILKRDTQRLNEFTQNLSQRVTVIESKVIHLDLILENEIRVSIKRVAERHLDLSRNLHETIRCGKEAEMLAIKVRMLESDVKELKSGLA